MNARAWHGGFSHHPFSRAVIGAEESATSLAAKLDAAKKAGKSAAEIAALQADLSRAVAAELAQAKQGPGDPVSRLLRWQLAIATGEPAPVLDGLMAMFRETGAPFDSTIVNNAFLRAVSLGLPDPLLGQLKTIQRQLIPSDLLRARQAAVGASSEKTLAMVNAAVAANSPPQLIDLLKQLHDEAVIRERGGMGPAKEEAEKKPEAKAEEEKPSVGMQVLTFALLTAPAWGTYLYKKLV